MKGEFPTASACGITLAAAARERVSQGEGARVTLFPRVRVETPVPPGFARSHWKGNGRKHLCACPFFSSKTLSSQLSAFSRKGQCMELRLALVG
jgi:hypothetical protein